MVTSKKVLYNGYFYICKGGYMDQQQIIGAKATLIGLIFFLLSLVAITAGASTKNPIHFGRYHALVIGNQHYRNLEELNTARTDAGAIAQILKKKYGFEVELLLDADRDRTIWTLAQLSKRINQDQDNLLIYYAGHSSLDKKTGAGYWKPIDAGKNSDMDWISTSLITNIIKALHARHVLVMSDAYYNDESLGRAKNNRMFVAKPPEETLRRILEMPSLTVLTSGAQEPIRQPGAENSLFTQALLNALDQNQNILSGSNLFHQIAKNTPLSPLYGYLKKTRLDQGDFLLVPKYIQDEKVPRRAKKWRNPDFTHKDNGQKNISQPSAERKTAKSPYKLKRYFIVSEPRGNRPDQALSF
ncbi:MAG: caspase family protein [Candidatus Electrothrix sp. AR3]|nr:caspase family protein [Candidatus Electrothrix sp. AR3]